MSDPPTYQPVGWTVGDTLRWLGEMVEALENDGGMTGPASVASLQETAAVLTNAASEIERLSALNRSYVFLLVGVTECLGQNGQPEQAEAFRRQGQELARKHPAGKKPLQ